MFLIWRGRGLLALVPAILLLGSCGGLIGFEQRWPMLVGVTASLLIGGAVCVHYGTRWNRRGVEHSLYFIPLQAWGWACLALLAVPAMLSFGFGAAARRDPPRRAEGGSSLQ